MKTLEERLSDNLLYTPENTSTCLEDTLKTPENFLDISVLAPPSSPVLESAIQDIPDWIIPADSFFDSQPVPQPIYYTQDTSMDDTHPSWNTPWPQSEIHDIQEDPNQEYCEVQHCRKDSHTNHFPHANWIVTQIDEDGNFNEDSDDEYGVPTRTFYACNQCIRIYKDKTRTATKTILGIEPYYPDMK